MRPTTGRTSVAPHPDHFDPTKYGTNGEPIGRRREVAGRYSNLSLEQAEQVLFLEQLATAAAQDLTDYLKGKGYCSKRARTQILQRLRGGWRPAK